MTLVRAAATGTRPQDVADVAARIASRALRDPQTRLWAQRAIAPYVPTTTDLDGRWYLNALGRWCASVAYMREPARYGEIVSAPWRVVAYRVGDCDDLATAAATFAAIAGLPAAVAVYDTAPGFAHMVALAGGSWRETGKAPTPRPDPTPSPADICYQLDHTGLRPFSPPTPPYIRAVR